MPGSRSILQYIGLLFNNRRTYGSLEYPVFEMWAGVLPTSTLFHFYPQIPLMRKTWRFESGERVHHCECIIFLSIFLLHLRTRYISFLCGFYKRVKKNSLYELTIYQALSLQTLSRRMKISPEQLSTSQCHLQRVLEMLDLHLWKTSRCHSRSVPSHFLSLDFLFYPGWSQP